MGKGGRHFLMREKQQGKHTGMYLKGRFYQALEGRSVKMNHPKYKQENKNFRDNGKMQLQATSSAPHKPSSN